MNRNTYPITENWHIYKEDKKYPLGYNPEQGVRSRVPSIMQEALPGYHGVAYYRCSFVPETEKYDGGCMKLFFRAVDYKAEVWLNDTFLGDHEGGEAPFSFDVTNVIKDGENTLCVRVVNPVETDIDGLNIVNVPARNKRVDNTAGSSLNHGGIWGEVELVSLPAVHIEDFLLTGDIHTAELTADVSVQNVGTLADGNMTVNVYARYNTEEKITGAVMPFQANGGENRVLLKLTVPDVKLWDVDDPYLYYVEITVEADGEKHSKIERFGFREFLVKDGYFMLNDRKIFLKSSHSGNAFPIGQGYPVVKEQIRKDMIMAKSYGFNMVRGIAGVFRKEQIEVCDEIGLMLYEECFAAWCTGRALGPYEKETSVGDEERMLKRFDACTLDMVKRDKNHPSVVVWGLLNETFKEESVSDRARELLPELRKIDPSRLVMFSSGRWDREQMLASASNPYSDTWDVFMGADGAEDYVPSEGVVDHLDHVGDFHKYPLYPFEDVYFDYIRNYAKDYLPAFISESGMGSLFNVIEEAKHYEQCGCSKDLEDYRWIKDQADKLEADWKRLGLTHVYPNPEMMLKESQRMNAEDRRRMFDAIRSNPKLSGYSLTGLLDHGWCGEGLWSLWRRFKPEMYDAICDGWASLRFCLFVKHHVFSGEEVEFEAVLANEILKPGTYTADFAITGPEGTVETWSVDFEIKDDAFSVPVMKKKLKLHVPGGKYSFAAYMQGASPLGNTYDFYVTDPKERPICETQIYAIGLEAETVNFLQENGVSVLPFSGDANLPIVVGKHICPEDFGRLQEATEQGGKVFYMNHEAFEDGALPVPGFSDVVLKKNLEWLYHKENVLANRTIFKGLGTGLADQKIFGGVITPKCMETERTPDDVICPAFYTGYHGYVGSYQCVYNLAGFRAGAGMVYLSTFSLKIHCKKNLRQEPCF